MKQLFAISLAILLTSCGASYHLKQSERHLKKAIELGAKQRIDTVTVEKIVIIPEVKFDTIVKNVNFSDTITVTKDHVITKIKINTIEKEVFIKTICPPDTVKIEVPVKVVQQIETGISYWWLLVVFIVTLLLCIIIRK